MPFWDTSALVKLYVRERDSDHFVELAYREFHDDVEDAVLKLIPYGRDVALEFDRIVRVCYRASPVVPIRALDGLLLASALTARMPDLVSTDLRMRDAGLLLGLRILP